MAQRCTRLTRQFLEAIRARYGGATHGVFITFGLLTNVLVTAMLLTGGSAVASALSGVPTAAACFLLPVGVVLYTIFGGIKATFLTDYGQCGVPIAYVDGLILNFSQCSAYYRHYGRTVPFCVHRFCNFRQAG